MSNTVTGRIMGCTVNGGIIGAATTWVDAAVAAAAAADARLLVNNTAGVAGAADAEKSIPALITIAEIGIVDGAVPCTVAATAAALRSTTGWRGRSRAGQGGVLVRDIAQSQGGVGRGGGARGWTIR